MNEKVRSMTRMAACTAVLCVLSQISFPLPSGVPVTLQTLGMALCGCLLGVRRGAICVAVYLLLGMAGLPVFAGFTGGVSKLAGPTGGFLIGFIFLAALCGLARGKAGLAPWLYMALGLLLCHAAGVIQFALLGGRSLTETFLVVSLPYIVKDALSLAAGRLLAAGIDKRLAPIA